MITNATERSKEYSLIDLIPYTNYTVTVLVKPSAATGDIYWSESNTLPFLTPTTGNVANYNFIKYCKIISFCKANS
jgi:hypothetical protein